MKWIKIVLSMMAVLGIFAFIPAANVSAQATLPPQCTGFQLQNPGAAPVTNIQAQFYKIGGTGAPTAISLPDLPANSSKSFYVPSYAAFSSLASGSYGVVISAGGALNALVNQTTCAGSSPLVLGSSSGISLADANTTVYLPWINSRAYAQSWSSAIAVQNAGSGATAVTLDFFKPGVAAAFKTITNSTLNQGETWFVDLSSGTYATTDLIGFAGAVKVTSVSQPVVAVANYGPAAGNKLLSYNGVPATAGSTKLYAPQVNKTAYAGNYTSGLTLYNPNATATPITIDYIASGATTPTFTQTTSIAANNVFIQYLGALTGLPSGFNGTAVVTVTSGTNKIFGVANLDSGAGQAAALNMIPIEQAATTLYMPQIVRHVSSGYESGWQVVNTTGTALTLTIEYWRDTDTTTPSFTDTKPLGANSALTNYVGSTNGVPAGFNGGVIIKVNGGAGKIVGQANFVNANITTGDPLSIYNAFK